MDFFKSVFTDDPDTPSSPTSEPKPDSSTASSLIQSDSPDSDSTPSGTPKATTVTGASRWSFGGLVKSLSARSESVIETYRRDLQEFGSGLKKETEVFREVASRAVKELPTSIEIGASRAQGSIESVGQAIDSIGSTVWKSTTEIIAQGKETLLSADLDSDASDASNPNSSSNMNLQNSARYSRFDAQLRAIQCDANTYIEEPEDLDDYGKWKLGFDLKETSEEIEGLMRENGNVEAIYKKLVPNSLDHEVFWCRYYYRIHKLKQAEFVRAKLVERAISRDEEEDLSWDVDDEEEKVEEEAEDAHGSAPKPDNPSPRELNLGNVEVSPKDVEEKKTSSTLQSPSGSLVVDHDKNEELGHMKGEEKGSIVDNSEEHNDEKSADEVTLGGKTEANESGKDSDISVISSHPSPEEDDLGWDEIEDLGSGDEKKVSRSGSPDRAELRKRLSTAEEEEDLSWDIEDDDEPVKA